MPERTGTQVRLHFAVSTFVRLWFWMVMGVLDLVGAVGLILLIVQLLTGPASEVSGDAWGLGIFGSFGFIITCMIYSQFQLATPDALTARLAELLDAESYIDSTAK